MHHKQHTKNTVYEIDNEQFQINPYFLRIFLVSKLEIKKSKHNLILELIL